MSHSPYVLHPWHGLSPGDDVPNKVACFIEIVPSDTIKYEVDKASGLVRVDRPQQFSNFCPAPYGFIPQTYCREQVAARAMERTQGSGIIGDGDPIDVCVLTEHHINRGGLLLYARPIGGLRMIDKGEADDKLICVLDGDAAYGHLRDLNEVPNKLVERLCHYFLTYKQLPGTGDVPRVVIAERYGAEEAREMVMRARRDYEQHFAARPLLANDTNAVVPAGVKLT